MELAFTTADNSKDPHTKVGAVIAKGDQIISYGWNGTPYGFYTNQCKDNLENTLPEVVHAEANAIAKAAASTASTKGASIYSTTVPCLECAKLIIQSGIKEVYYVNEYNKCTKGKNLLEDSKIKLIKL